MEINIEDVTNSSVEERCENVEGGGGKKDEIQYTVFIFMYKILPLKHILKQTNSSAANEREGKRGEGRREEGKEGEGKARKLKKREVREGPSTSAAFSRAQTPYPGQQVQKPSIRPFEALAIQQI